MVLLPETLGDIVLHIALIMGVFTFGLSILAGRRGEVTLIKAARNGVWVVSGLVFLAAISLWVCIFQGRYHVEYVHGYTNSTTPFFYKFAALWGGQQGSLLFWLLILCAYASLVMWRHRQKQLELIPYVISTLMGISIFFLVLLIWAANPFDTVPFNVADGRGLNPLLQNFYMIIHPPSLYLGFVGMSVPFAFALSALISGQLDNRWIIQIRGWTLLAWFFLSVGNLLGASWSYEVLGWGGYWAWDPVENAAFIPWLTASAFIHSVIIQEKRGMLRTWNMVLVILSFVMTLVGTFLTRSGIVSSVHSFAQSNIGSYFLVFIVLVVLVSVFFLLYRLPELRSKNELDSYVSREAAFLFNNLILLGSAFAILWGTLFPVFSEWVRGSKITVGPPYFNAIMIPIGLLLLLLTGVGPIISWRKMSMDALKRHFMIPVLSCIFASLLLLLLVPKTSSLLTNVYVNITFSFSVFVMVTIFLEYQKGTALRKRIFGEDTFTALLRLVANNRRRYGGYLVHLGLVLMFIGFAGNAFRQEAEYQMQLQEVKQLGAYQIRYEKIVPTADAHRERVSAEITVWKGNELAAVLNPTRVFYKSAMGEDVQPYTEVDVKRGLKEDVYMALLSFDPQNRSIFLKAIINPLVQWIWIGGLFLIMGALVSMWPGKRKAALYA